MDPGIRVVDPVHRYLMDPEAVALSLNEEFGVEEPGLILDHVQEGVHGIATHGLESTLGIGESAPERAPQDQVVGPRDELPLAAARHA